jgi:hypothetical protein
LIKIKFWYAKNSSVRKRRRKIQVHDKTFLDTFDVVNFSFKIWLELIINIEFQRLILLEQGRTHKSWLCLSFVLIICFIFIKPVSSMLDDNILNTWIQKQLWDIIYIYVCVCVCVFLPFSLQKKKKVCLN